MPTHCWNRMKIEKYTQYKPLGNAARRELLDNFLVTLERHARVSGIDWENIKASNDRLIEIIERVEKRRVYFWVFHGVQMNEVKEAALYCFWLLKLKPFYLENHTPNREVNACLAFGYFFNTLLLVTKKREIKFPLSANTTKDIYYAFRFHDLSKESLMAIAKMIVPSEGFAYV